MRGNRHRAVLQITALPVLQEGWDAPPAVRAIDTFSWERCAGEVIARPSCQRDADKKPISAATAVLA